MLTESIGFRTLLRERAADNIRDTLLSTEISAAALRCPQFQHDAAASLTGDPTETHRFPPSPREIKRRANYAKRRRRLGEHWRENTLKRAYLLLRGKRGTALEQQRCVSLCAWLFAITGMLVCIGFLLADFFKSRDSPALISQIVEQNELQLPVVTFCTVMPGLPSFGSFPTKNYSGRPIFASRSYTDRSTNTTLWFPETHTSGRVTPFMHGPPAKCEKESKVFSFERINTETQPEDKCLSCYQIGVNPPIVLSNQKSSTSGRIRVEFSVSRELNFCLLPRLSSLAYLRRELLRSIKEHGEKLEQAGILVLSGTTDLDFALDNAFDTMRRRSRGNDTAYNIALGSFVCNVYYASGFFYPKPQHVDIKYRYDINTDAWEEIGRGPYHKLTAESSNNDLSSMKYHIDLGRTILVFARDRSLGLRPKYRDNIGFLQVLKTANFRFSKIIDDEVPVYNSHRPLAAQYFQLVRERYLLFEANLDYEHFRVEMKSREPSISVSELVNDIFQYGALFTGVCVYSILVGPAKWYLKRSAAGKEARNVANNV